MAEPIKNKRLNDLTGAPTPQNTPATAASSFISRAADAKPSVSTIAEEDGASGAAAAVAAAAAANPAANLSLLNMIQGRLSGLINAPSGYLETLPSAVKARVNGLRAVQSEHDKLEAKFQEELLELEKKYFALYSPLYAKRAQIISGTLEPTTEEIAQGKKIAEELQEEWDEQEGTSKPRLEEISEEDDEKKDDEEDDEEDEDEDEEDKDEKAVGIPNFWLTALRTLPEITELITDRDAEALGFLKDIRMKYLDQPGFALEFDFEENPFFSNKTLSKTYFYQDEPGYGGDYIYDHATGDDIAWKSSEQNLTVKIEKRKQRNKHTKATRTIEKSIPVESFFHFFSPPTPPSIDDEDEVDRDEDEDEEIEAKLELDYHIGEVIKEKLIPRAIDWFTGEALRYEEYDDEDEYGGEFDDDEDEDEDDDEDDDDDDVPRGGAKKDEECKQS
ncbi:uncharacterized protein SAPINGB_P000573 [Magnusiomyces paraingens]|uniref:Nucleosome assembly protein n=1 Tax=Magnusiomyces paraingens TaxID=2606893 RepID=A0A5E8B1V5_9ASCO|nr:uncharacterized protein SAPINGB_P000573 [Saprochaete ingens]VVT44905.1 unnamed protein product [Saprochaete ingens]